MRTDKAVVDILTLSERESSGLLKLSDVYPNINNVEFKGLDDLSFYDRPKVTTHDIHRRYIDGEDVYGYYENLVKQNFNEKFSMSVKDISDVLCEIILNGYDVILSPVGLSHPYHIATRNGIELALNLSDSIKSPSLIYYVDKPYVQYRYVTEMYNSFKSLYGYIEMTSPLVNKEDSVVRTLKEVYPTELGMLRFSKEVLTEFEDFYIYKFGSGNERIHKFKEILK